MRDWSFDVRGLPATDTRTGEILVADAGRERVLQWESVTLFSLRPGAAARPMNVLLDSATIGSLHVMDDESQEIRFREQIAAGVRDETRAANTALAGRPLRPLDACHLPADAPTTFCTHPQKVICGERTFELDDDALRWGDGSVRTGWEIPPMEIGDGPPKKMVACIEEAHLDVVTMQIAIRFHQVCEGGGSDACILGDEWRALGLKR